MKKYIKIFGLAVFLLSAKAYLYPQEAILEREPAKSNFDKDTGPNKKRFGHLFIDYGCLLNTPFEESIQVNPLRSSTFTVGYRYKWKLNSFYDMGGSMFLKSFEHNLKQVDDKEFPNSMIHEKEKFSLFNAGFGFFNRFNMGKRGNHIKYFIDIGAFTCYRFGQRHVTLDGIEGENPIAGQYHASKVKSVYTKLDYSKPIHYGLMLRLGYSRIAFWAGYRFSGILKKSYSYKSLPPVSLGLELGLF